MSKELKSIWFKGRFLNFIVGFAGGTMITLTIAKPKSEIGCIVIGLLFGVLYMELEYASRNSLKEREVKE